jgi:phage terminase small subunit
MPVLKNAKHELFAQALAKGMSAIRAYEAAGYKPDRGAASRLSANVSISVRLNELLEKAAERTLVTVERVTAELEQARQLAMSQPRGALAAVSASMSKAKLHGLLDEKKRTRTKLSYARPALTTARS